MRAKKDKYYIISLICRIPKKPSSSKQRVAWWLPGAGGRKYEEMLVKGYKLSVGT